MSKLDKYNKSETNKTVSELLKVDRSSARNIKRPTKPVNFRIDVELWENLQILGQLTDTTTTQILTDHIENITRLNKERIASFKELKK